MADPAGDPDHRGLAGLLPVPQCAAASLPADDPGLDAVGAGAVRLRPRPGAADGPRGPFHRGAECPQRPDGILLLLWIANIVIISGAALDAEFLRARQIASGLHAWHTLQLEPHATHTIDFLADDSAQAERLGRAVAGSVREGTPLHRERGPWIVDSQHLLAVNPPRRRSRSADPSTSGDAQS